MSKHALREGGEELIITNGDSGADLLRDANIGDHWLPWRDVLHEGPVPLTHDLPSLSIIRAEYIASKGWADKDQTLADFKERDDFLIHADKYPRVALWFEHDLYDQLQLIQILDAFLVYSIDRGRIHLVQADDYLGHQTPETIGRFIDKREPVTTEQFHLAKEAWTAFRQPTPEALVALLEKELTALPFLKSAVFRMLEELPAVGSGLSRSEQQILSLIDRGVSEVKELFLGSQKMEEAMFMGDWSFFDRVMGLAHCPTPLISGLENFGSNAYQNDEKRKEFLSAHIELTEFGNSVLSGDEDFASQNTIQFWWGGSQINADNPWRWDQKNKRVIKS